MQLPANSHTNRPPIRPRHHVSTPAVTTRSSDVTPPIPKPRTRSASPSRREPSPKPLVATGGVRVLPPITSLSSNPSPPQLPSYSSIPAATTTTATPVLPSYEAAISAQPPPKPKRAANTKDQYTLPDPTASLNPKQLETVKQISDMGFPPPRVARATKHFNDSAKVRLIIVLYYPV